MGLWFISVFLYPKTIGNFASIFLGFLLYYMAIKYTKNIKRILWAVVAVSALNTIFAILQFLGIHFIYNATGRSDGLMLISNHLGVYQAIAMPICYLINPYLAIIPFIGLLLSKSILGLLVGLAGMFYLINKKVCLFVPIVFMSITSLLVGYFLLNFKLIVYKLSIRGFVWFETLKQILDKFIVGYGIGNFKLPSQYGQYDNSYNLYLGITHALGIFGLILLALFLKNKFHNYKDNLTATILTSCLILLLVGLGMSFMNYPRLAGTAIILFAFLEIKRKEILCL